MLIGLTGPSGSGKRFVADRIAAIANDPAEIRAFADPLKDSLCAFLGITREQLEIYKRDDSYPLVTVLRENGDPRPMNAREAMERYGDEAHRQIFGSSFWVTEAQVEIDDLLHDHEDRIVIFDDVRYENEVSLLHKFGGMIWEVTHPDTAYGLGHDSRMRLPVDLIAFGVHNNPSNTVPELDAILGSLLAAHRSMSGSLSSYHESRIAL